MPDKQNPQGDQIIEEGRAGLNFAYNSINELTEAKNAKQGEMYICPFCGCKMFLTSRKGRPYFARRPNHMHLSPTCKKIETSGKEHTFASLDPEKFIISLCRATQRKGPGPGGGGGKKPIAGPGGEDPIIPFSSLKQIAESGISEMKAEDKYGDHCLSEYIMTYRFGPQFFQNPNFVLGARIVFARYLGAISSNRVLIFEMFRVAGAFSVKFTVSFRTQSDYKSKLDKLEHVEVDEQGRTRYMKNHRTQDALIACDQWEKIDKSQCSFLCPKKGSCRGCCGMFYAVYTSSKQLYLLPAED